MNLRTALLPVCGLFLLVLSAGCQPSGRGDRAAGSSDRVLVVIVPGTYSSANFWPTVQDGRASFGSELLRALPKGSQVFPLIWESSFRHANRERAVDHLVEEINKRAGGFDRVCLVGHSHGGNIALLAAGKCQSRIDMVICLATPHVHLKGKTPGQVPYLPVYCPPATLANTGMIVTMVATTDRVSEWLDFLPLKGMTEETAIELTDAWQDQQGHPRLYRDDIFLRALPLPHLDNLVVAERLHVEALHFDVHSLVYDKLPIIGVKSHNHLHSRRMGYVLGELIRDGPTREQVQYIRGLIQPADADDGEPVPADRYAGWLERAEAAFIHAGWSLEKASVELSEEAPAPITRLWDASPPDLALRVQSSDRAETWGETDTAQNCRRATWEPEIFVYEGKRFVLDVRDGKDILARSLGGRTLVADESLPTHLPADPEGGVFWSGDFEWQPMHY